MPATVQSARPRLDGRARNRRARAYNLPFQGPFPAIVLFKLARSTTSSTIVVRLRDRAPANPVSIALNYKGKPYDWIVDDVHRSCDSTRRHAHGDSHGHSTGFYSGAS